MATATLSNALPTFPVGTSVGAYPISGERQNRVPDSGQAPQGSATATATVAADGSLAFTGLADGTVYAAGAQVSGSWKYRQFRSSGGETSHFELQANKGQPGGYGQLTTGQYQILPSGDSGAAVQAAITALGATGGEIVLLDGVHTWSTIPALPAGVTRQLRIRGLGRGNTTLQLGAAVLRAFDVNKVADGNTFQNITFEDLTVDASAPFNAGAYSTNQHILFGNLVNGNAVARINFSNITVRRCEVIVPPIAAATPSLQCVSLWAKQTVGGEASSATTIKDIRVEDCVFGGHFGVAAISTVGSGVGTAACDRIFIDRVRHDTGTVPTTLTGSSGLAQLGGNHGSHGYCEITRCTSLNSWDIGVEVDGFQRAVIERNTFQDAYNEHVLLRNQSPPADIPGQQLVVRKNLFRNVNLDPSGTNGISRHIVLGTTSSTTNGTGDTTNASASVANASGTWRVGQTITGTGIPAGTIVKAVSGATLTLSQNATATNTGTALSYSDFQLGSVLIDGNASDYETALADIGARSGVVFNCAGANVQHVAVRNHRIGTSAFNYNPASVGGHLVFFDIASLANAAVVEVDGVSVEFGGSGTNAANFVEGVRVGGTDTHLALRNVSFDLEALSNGTLSSLNFMPVTVGNQGSAAKVHGTIEGVKAHNSAIVSATLQGVFLGTNLTFAGGQQIIIRGCDFSKWSSSGGSEYTVQSAQAPNVQILDYAGTRNNSGGIQSSIASATTVTLSSAGNVFTLTGTTTITSITASWTGRVVQLLVNSAITVTDGSNLKLAGNFVGAATGDTDVLTLVSDGTNWLEVARSVN